MSGAAPDEAAVTALEASIADAGALLVRFERYRGGGGPAAARLRRDALLLGDEARALHRRGGLDGDAARTLLARARELGARIEAALAGWRAPRAPAAPAAN